jgi:hypothetical protein
MTEKKKRGRVGLDRLNQLQPPAWIAEMRKHYVEHGTVRSEDVARLLGDQVRLTGPLAEVPQTTTVELLQQMARNRRK